jgi:2-isopropylmalate synthase
MLPNQVADVVDDVVRSTGARVGIHCHNDTGCAVANSMAAVDAGATHVQGTVNGYGERTGNADLLTVVANLQLKRGLPLLEPHRLQESTRIAHAIAEVTNVPAYSRQPYVGSSAFAHKAGLHASAIKVDPDLYQHMDPKAVGNDMRMLVSDMAGRASIELKSRELGFDLDATDERDNATLARVLRAVKERELRGYTFDAADASFELLLRRELDGSLPEFFDVESWRVITDARGDDEALSEATVKLVAAGERGVRTGEGNGPVNALDQALRSALAKFYPEIRNLELIDYKVRILDAAHGTDAVTRVLIETSDGTTSWTTIGVAANILEASWDALVESVTYGLVRAGVAPR